MPVIAPVVPPVVPPVVLPVVHHLADRLAEAQFELALACGADGAFLISHEGRDDAVLALASRLAARHGSGRVGVNLLSRPFARAWREARDAGAGMVWTDDPGIAGGRASAEALSVSREAAGGGPLAFASVAFKYRPHEPEPGAAARLAHRLGFVPTTSGPATGVAPDPSKTGAMRAALGPDAPLAVASGLAAWNVGLHLRDEEGVLATHLLVSTSVSSDAHRFDRARLEAFVRAARGTA